ncbi:MAG: Zn-ribbon domain-containing OB-fold protein [Burkholderiales bacterium]
MSDAYAKPLPIVDGPNKPFWEGARTGTLMLQRCLDCKRYRFPASRYCSNCLGGASEWQVTSGQGTVVSYCGFHKAYWPSFANEVPYDVVQVRLKEGVQLFSNLVDVPRESIKIGMKVRAHFDAVTGEVTLVRFTL